MPDTMLANVCEDCGRPVLAYTYESTIDGAVERHRQSYHTPTKEN